MARTEEIMKADNHASQQSGSQANGGIVAVFDKLLWALRLGGWHIGIVDEWHVKEGCAYIRRRGMRKRDRLVFTRQSSAARPGDIVAFVPSHNVLDLTETIPVPYHGGALFGVKELPRRLYRELDWAENLSGSYARQQVCNPSNGTEKNNER
ncbi:hypothetical protein BISU_1059 [Bifidobacterium subtile]|jgi:hypothetical protein|uniref:Uncharacterized protein n=2 Tax=Bifidobacterium TaxID=1678 RepID=A0A087E5S6_9BIFI|nr:hypothetical protein BISU_1059 [Bifidobacterium subtile]